VTFDRGPARQLCGESKAGGGDAKKRVEQLVNYLAVGQPYLNVICVPEQNRHPIFGLGQSMIAVCHDE
jgi:hypothetical protein